MPIQYGLLTKEQLNAVAALLPDVGLTATTGSIYAIGAVKNNYICGILIFRADGELLIDIQYIAVAEACRRQGIATGLLDFLCKSALESTTAIFCTFAAADCVAARASGRASAQISRLRFRSSDHPSGKCTG